MYVKTKQELRRNVKCKESELKTATNIARGKRPKTTGERATFCLAVMFTVYLITQLLTYVYNLIQHTAALTKAISRSAAQLFPQSVLLVVTCFGYFATISPLLMLMNYRYRQYVKEILCCALDSQDGRKHPIQQLQIGHDGLPMLQPKPKASPNNIKMFFCANIKSHSYMTTSEHDLSPLERSRTTFDYDLSDSLLLSKAGTPVLFNNFLWPEEEPAMELLPNT